jgi:hypothetical protein
MTLTIFQAHGCLQVHQRVIQEEAIGRAQISSPCSVCIFIVVVAVDWTILLGAGSTVNSM